MLYGVFILGPFPFAKCFICQEMGHLSRSCPENPRGLYPQGTTCDISLTLQRAMKNLLSPVGFKLASSGF